jgi:hypothetical protein
MINNIYLPVKNYTRISSKYEIRKNPTGFGEEFHKGIDFVAPIGTPVYAVKSGIISQIGLQVPTNSNIGLGKRITIDYSNDPFDGRYGHLSEFAINQKTGKIFEIGELVEAGQIIGYVGSTGRSTGPHLHYEESYFKSINKKIDRNPMPQFESLINNSKTPKPELRIDTQDTSFQQAIDLLLGKNQATDPNQTIINDLSDYDKVTINNTKTNSYIIKSGDSFNQIADKLIAEGRISSRQELIDANPDIIDLDIINVGDVINIPLHTTTANFSIAFKSSLDNKAFENLIDPSKASLTLSYADKDGNPLSQDDIDQMILTAQDSNNNDILLLKENSIFTTIKDGTIATVESVIEAIDYSIEATERFINIYIIKEVNNLFLTKKLNYN